MADPAPAAGRARPERLDRLPVAPFVKDGDLKGLVDQGVVGVTSNPTIFQGAIAEGDAYDDQIRELSAEHDDPKEIFWLLAKDDIRDACDVLRPVWDEGQRQGRLGLARGRPEPRARHRGDQVRGRAPARARRPPEPLHQDPGDRGGPAGDRGHDRRRHPGQRHADLLARAPPQGRRGLHRAASSASSTAAATRPASSPRSPRSSSRAWTPRPTSASTQIGGHDELKGTLAIANAKLAYQTYQEVFSGPRVGGAGGQGRDASSAACGRRPRPRTRPTATSSTSRSSSARTRSTRCRASTIEAVDDHGEIRGDTIKEDVEGAQQIARRVRGRRRQLRRRRRRCSSARAWRSSPSRSPT